MRPNGYNSPVHDWMRAIRRPTPYRVGNAKLHMKTRTVMYFALFVTAVSVLVVYFISTITTNMRTCKHIINASQFIHNKYPLTPPRHTVLGWQYSIGVVTDLDTDSLVVNKHTWYSKILKANLTVSDDYKFVSVRLDDRTQTIISTIAQDGRGMELSELIVYNNKLLTVDDRTGIIYEISNNEVYPWVILSDGNGRTNKGFKAEWASVKDGRLIVGGLGKEWTTVQGKVLNNNPQWVKSIGPNGDIKHIDWQDNYNALRKATHTSYPGYLIHESAVWSDIHKKWFFLPRRASKDSYEEKADERRATNLLIMVDENFKNIVVRTIGDLNPTHGFSSFKFIPNTNDQMIIALKSEEDNGKIASYILAFNIDGDIIMPEMKIGNVKYEGIEFL